LSMNALEIAAIGLQQDTDRLKVIGHNVANITTTGFKRQVAVQASFSDAMNVARSSSAALSVHTDQRAGRLRATGNALDVALGEQEYLLVQTAARGTALTRDGALVVDANGRLTTSGGLAVQGTGGDITIPRTARDVRIDAAGNVLADDTLVGTLNVMRLATGQAVQAVGNGLFVLAGTGQLEAARVSTLRAGHLEASNVVASQEMVNLMTTTRHAESMVRLIQGADEMLEKSIRKFGEL